MRTLSKTDLVADSACHEGSFEGASLKRSGLKKGARLTPAPSASIGLQFNLLSPFLELGAPGALTAAAASTESLIKTIDSTS